MKWLDYRQKLGISFCDRDKTDYVITNLLSYVRIAFSHVDGPFFISYILDVGAPLRRQEFAIDDDMMNEYRGKEIFDILMVHQEGLEDFLSYFIPLINRSDREERNNHKAFLEKMLKNAYIPCEIVEDSDGFFIFPKGAKELDDALVSQPLEWLKQYPESEKAWIKALKSYADATKANASDVADLFRKTLETFFREFFKGNKSLENYKKDYGDYLKGQGIPAEISNNLETLLQAYTNFINNYAKHRDATSDKVLEYLMYQTGNTMRLLITLEGQP